MEITDKLTRLAKLHNEWLGIARKFGIGNISEDIVQETYIRIIRLNYIDKIVTDEKINKSYMWLTIHSVYIDHLRKEKHNIKSIEEIKGIEYEQSNVNQLQAISNIDLKIEKEIESWHWYDAMLFRIYKDSELSMRDISEKANISLTSIFNTLKKCKERLKEKISEDYEDYLNNDYELIN